MAHIGTLTKVNIHSKEAYAIISGTERYSTDSIIVHIHLIQAIGPLSQSQY